MKPALHVGAAQIVARVDDLLGNLTRLYTATGDARYLEGAKRGFAFFHMLHPNAWTNYASCKTMWAGAEISDVVFDLCSRLVPRDKEHPKR